jgi:RecA-family ATPase
LAVQRIIPESRATVTVCARTDSHRPGPARVAIISREDNPALTSWRLKHLLSGKSGGNVNLIEQNLYINSRQQTPEFMLDQPDQVAELVAALRDREIEFAIFDVFNVMHAADENDNTEMRGVLRFLSQIQADTKCSIGVVHHFNKAETGSMTQRLRGASSIAGWAEWLIGISIVDEATKLRRMDFELKAAQPPESITYKITSNDANGVAALTRMDGGAQ